MTPRRLDTEMTDPNDPAGHAHVVDMHALHEATEAAKAAGVSDIQAVNEAMPADPAVPVPGPDAPTWTIDDDRLVFTDAEGYTASLTRFGGNAALAAGFHALVADVRAARAHEHCGPAGDTLREVLHLWMGGWRPRFDLWVNGWDPTQTKPITPAHRAVLDEANPEVDGGGDG